MPFTRTHPHTSTACRHDIAGRWRALFIAPLAMRLGRTAATHRGTASPRFSVTLFMMKGNGSIALECTYLGGVLAQPGLALIKLGALTWHANVYDGIRWFLRGHRIYT